MRINRWTFGAATSVLLTASLIFAGGVGASTTPKVHRGGSMVVLEVGGSWTELDPATNVSDAGDEDIMNVIYGELFEQGPHGTVLPDIATKYAFADHNLLVRITLRHGVKFQDGTALTATAVQSSIERDLLPSNACLCDSDFSDVKSITTNGPYEVDLHLSAPYAPIIEAFIDEAPNWTVDPSALASMGVTAYSQKPVGAGPFEVVSNQASSQLVLNRNPLYWHAGEPYLQSLTFTAVASLQSAYEGLQAGDAQVLDPVTDPTTLRLAAKHFDVYNSAPRSASWVQINPNIPPFNNIVAREAIYYATNARQLLKTVGDNYGTVTETPTGSGDLVYEPTVPGYRTYDLAKAKALVKQLGGLSFTLMDVSSPASTSTMEALQSEYEAAGMTVTIAQDSIGTVIQLYGDDGWQISLEGGGEVDPSLGVGGLNTRYDGILGNVHDPVLDALLQKATDFLNINTRTKIYSEIFKRITTEAYGPYLYVTPFAVITSKSVTGVDVQTGPIGAIVNWETVGLK